MKLLLYLIRWQLSTPILACCIYFLTKQLGYIWTTIIANLVGGLMFFWIDKLIFKNTDILFSGELWEIKDNIKCYDCQKLFLHGYRLVKTSTYDRSHDKDPQFRCQKCSRKKYDLIKEKKYMNQLKELLDLEKTTIACFLKEMLMLYWRMYQ